MRAHWLDVLHLLDSSFPTGSYVHSFGLESFSSAQDELEAIIRLRVEQALARLDLVFVDHAYRVDLVELDRRYHVMQLVREPREASAAIGTSLLRSAADVLSDARVGQFLRDGPHHHHSVAYGAVAAALDMPTQLAMQSYALGSVRGQVSAAQRLGWIGQREAQRMLHRLKPALLAAVADASSMNLDDVGAFVPTWEIAAMAHERADARMFAS